MTLATMEALRTIAPSWPLQQTVAVNPFWNQIDRPFSEVMAKMSHLIHSPLYMPAAYYLEKYQRGEIKEHDLEMAGRAVHASGARDSFDLRHFVQVTSDLELGKSHGNCFSDFFDQRTGSNWHAFVTSEIAKYASAFFDTGQALARFPWSDLGFYRAWFKAQAFDRSFQCQGIGRFYEIIEEFGPLAPEMAMDRIAARFGFSNDEALGTYLSRLSLLNVGWASQFGYNDWKALLGCESNSKCRSVDLIAVQMIVDYALAASFEGSHPQITQAWIESFNRGLYQSQTGLEAFEVERIWQAALEISRQRQLAANIHPGKEQSGLPRVQIAMCIDVRSETYRRAIESVSAEIETIGFAGFFGLAFDYVKLDEKTASPRAPVLLKPSFKVQEEAIDGQNNRRVAATLADSYFRNLRKAPLSSFFFVEVFGLPVFGKMLARFFRSLANGGRSALPKRFSDQATRPSPTSVFSENDQDMQLDEKIERAAKILKHMGLASRFGKLVVFAGHGSQNVNNAFQSASDCGACGGHSGDVNARVFATLLNDPEVRKGLRKSQINIPDTTHFAAAIHETVTDELYILDRSQIPDSCKEELAFLSTAIKEAGELARQERRIARSGTLDSSPWRRSRNWSEVRPEWALAGNSCFIVAPRRFTLHSSFAGQAFLHDYDWHQDVNFETLELIMTAPMLVTNWINMQYYVSTVAPKIYGSGNKILHNLVNENGVVEGNGGDLRIGLPWQSVNDGTRFVHEPVRLSVFIAAPVDEIEKVIAKHPTVQNLVENEWLFIFQIDDQSGESRQRLKGGGYVAIRNA